jgi:hypothetical protein
VGTEHWFTCDKCGWEGGPNTMFEGLFSLAKSDLPVCGECKNKAKYLFKFELGLEAGDDESEAIAAFLPDDRDKWTKKNDDAVEFFPFLVVLRDCSNQEHFHWLPYWHVVRTKGGTQTKYGQWAPMIRSGAFQNLIKQAHDAGFLK